MSKGEGQRERPHASWQLEQVEIGVAGPGTADLDEYLTWPRLGHRHVPKLARPLPFDELEGLDVATPLLSSVRSP